jgi:acyl CoA:acetate/3-ketoacid CoA transferase alpha subunit/acyl CoA:acetate/3-ketoacid CoA transferase beta subunit
VEHLSLSDAVEKHVRPGDALHLFYGHSRWSAAAREVCRQFWGLNPEFELQAVSLGNIGTLFVHGGLLRRCVTSYVGNSIPTGGPNSVYTRAYQSGELEIEHWSTLTFQQRVEAAARGLPALVTSSLTGTSMADNAGFEQVETTLGTVSLVAPLHSDVAIIHAPVADVHGNVAMSAPMMEGPWAGWAARRGALVTVERVVDDLSGYSHLVQLPAHRVLAVVEAPFGAHPGGLYAPGLPVAGYGEDIPFWSDIVAASKGDYDAWARQWCLDVPTQEEYLRRLGPDRLKALEARAEPTSWRADAEAHPIDEAAPITSQELVAAVSAREMLDRIQAIDADAIVPGAGISNLAAWVAAIAARRAGSRVRLAADVGMWGFEPTPADPLIFNHRAFSGAEMLTDCSRMLGLIGSGPGTRTIGALAGAQIDCYGNINSTVIPGTSFLAGSGGAADVAARADECIVSVVANRRRLVAKCAYITSPGRNVRSVCTDLGTLRKRDDGELHLSAVLAGDEPIRQRVQRMVESCGWELQVSRDLEEMPMVSLDEVIQLRNFDRDRLFLSCGGSECGTTTHTTRSKFAMALRPSDFGTVSSTTVLPAMPRRRRSSSRTSQTMAR